MESWFAILIISSDKSVEFQIRLTAWTEEGG